MVAKLECHLINTQGPVTDPLTEELLSLDTFNPKRPGAPILRVQKHKRVAKPLMVELSLIMVDELGDGPARGS